MFKVLDACARYRLNQLTAFETIERLKLKYDGEDTQEAKLIVQKYCSVFSPNEKIDF